MMVVRRACKALLAFACVITVGACSDPGANEAPEVTGPSIATDEDTPVLLHALVDARDPDGDDLSVVRAKAPGHTALVVGPDTIRVTPKQDFHGTIQVEYVVTDGHSGHVATAQATVTVRPVNDLPIAVSGTMTVRGTSAVVLEAEDLDGDVLTFEVTAGPAHGTLAGNAPRLEYTPEAGYLGIDRIEYRVFDGQASVGGTWTLQVGGARPVALASTTNVFEDMARAVTLQATDADGDPLTFTVETPPAHGRLDGAPPLLVYTPDKDFAGTDSIVFTATDGILTSAPAAITLAVIPLDDGPIAKPMSLAVAEDGSLPITLEGSDAEGDALSFEIWELPRNGELTGSGASWTYMPNANYHGSDSFWFFVRAGRHISLPAQVTIDVQSVDDPPIAESFTALAAEDVSRLLALRGTDAEYDVITYAIASDPEHGTLAGEPPVLVYTPAANFHGTDSFTYTVTAGTATSKVGTVTLQVRPRNDPPTADDVVVTTAEDTAVPITLVGEDIDGDVLSFSIESRPADGEVTGTGANRTYTPAPNATGTRSFTYSVFDGFERATATVTIEITPVNDPPTTRDDFVMADPGIPLSFSVTANDVDVESDSFQLAAVDAPAHGDVKIVDGELVYTPADGFTGTDLFAYTVVDAHGDASTGKVHVGVGAFPPGAPAETIAIVGGTFAEERAPTVSGDGRYVAFSSPLPLVPEDTNDLEDVYLFDRSAHRLSRVSVSRSGGPGNGASLHPHLSANGRYVVFESTASNLIDGDTNGVSDVLRHDRVTGALVRVSVNTRGGEVSGPSTAPTVSDDGGLVAFASSASDLVDGDANRALDVFVRELATSTTTRISVGAGGSDADGGSWQPAISGDGRFVAFSSWATDLAPGDTNGVQDVFVRDRIAGTTTRVSVSTTGLQANGASSGPSLSRDGRVVSFVSSASNLVTRASGDLLYVRDLGSQTTTCPVAALSVSWGRLSGDGRYVTLSAFDGVMLHDRVAVITETVPDANYLLWPVLSSNGRYLVAFDLNEDGRITALPNPL